MRIRIGIFFGGPSREREVSFAGGRTVYDNLNKSIFEPVPVFINARSQPILLDWEYIYKGSIRDFFPPVQSLPPSPHNFQVYEESLGELTKGEQEQLNEKIGKPLQWQELPELMDIAFLAMHGESGEDGRIQGLLELLGIPYTGSGIFSSSFGMDKALQKRLMTGEGFATPAFDIISKAQWEKGDPQAIWEKFKAKTGEYMVIRPARQGSSIGVTILQPGHHLEEFVLAMEKALFRETINVVEWAGKSDTEKYEIIRSITDIREGIGFPMKYMDRLIYHPEELYELLEKSIESTLILEAEHTDNNVLIESFINGKEFSCIVVRDGELGVVALPPTEIIKQSDLFDYRSKYLPGLSRKKTPIDLPEEAIVKIQRECERLFTSFEFQCYARIDGFYQEDGTIFLNDPNTTSGMMPSSFFFHQAAEIGLDPSTFLSFIIHSSLEERISTTMNHIRHKVLLKRLKRSLGELRKGEDQKKTVAVILGGYSFERHISVESGRNIYEKLASSDKYVPIPFFLLKDGEGHRLIQLPISLLLKDNADDIADKIRHFKMHPITENIREKASSITDRFSASHTVFEPLEWSYAQLKNNTDAVFIALHGRPGEDGTVQTELEKYHLPYNGSNPDSSSVTINKYNTLQTLKDHGFIVAQQTLVEKIDFEKDRKGVMDRLESAYGYPFIGKPVDDGCSSAVIMIKDREMLEAYLGSIFRQPDTDLTFEQRKILRLHPNDEFPAKENLLFENKIDKGKAKTFMEITTGLMTSYENGEIKYTIFEPSESLAGSEILSLEEKFLAGEGQNITPARLGNNEKEYESITAQIKKDLEKAARILGVTGYARIDAFVRVYEDLSVETIIIEVNSLPGMTPATCIFHQAALEGMKPADFIDRILEFGIKSTESSYAQ